MFVCSPKYAKLGIKEIWASLCVCCFYEMGSLITDIFLTVPHLMKGSDFENAFTIDG